MNVVTDPDHDFIPAGQSFVRSDTGELTRSWNEGDPDDRYPQDPGRQRLDRRQELFLEDATFEFSTRKAVVALTSIDGEPLATSRFILVTAIAQARSAPPQPQAARRGAGTSSSDTPFASEPVVGEIKLRSKTTGLELLSLGPDGKVVSRTTPSRQPGRHLDHPASRPRHPLVRAHGQPRRPGRQTPAPAGQSVKRAPFPLLIEPPR